MRRPIRSASTTPRSWRSCASGSSDRSGSTPSSSSSPSEAPRSPRVGRLSDAPRETPRRSGPDARPTRSGADPPASGSRVDRTGWLPRPRRGRVRPGLPGARRRAPARRRRQGAPARRRVAVPGRRGLPAGGAHRRAAQPSEHRAGLRRRPHRRRPVLRREQVHGGRRPEVPARPRPAGVRRVGGAGHRGLRRPAIHPHPGPVPPRHQAGQHPARRGRRPIAGRLRAGCRGTRSWGGEAPAISARRRT